MGLIKAAIGAVGGALADQWLEYFVCDSMEADVLAMKGQKKAGKRSSNTKGEDDIISNGSGIVVNKGQAAIIIADGKVADICAEEGTYTFDAGTEPSVFSGGFGAGLKGMLASMGDRIKHGGIPAKQHRIYYFNTKEIVGNKYGTPQPIAYKIADPDINLKLLISLRCNGEYSYRIINPAAFYGFCGNVADTFTRDKIDSQLKSEIITNLGPAFAKLGSGLEYQELPARTLELAKILNEQLSSEWRDVRGIEIVKFGISALSALPEDEARIKQLQAAAVMRDPTMAAASLVNAQGDAMRTAAGNTSGAMTGFMGMGMAGQIGGMNAQNLYAMGRPQGGTPQGGAPDGGPAPAAGGWDCSCGHKDNTGKFCTECGKPKPQPAYRCNKCGWEPPDPKNIPKFCPECGDAFDENDIKK